MAQQLGNTLFYGPDEVATVINRDYQTALRRIKNGDIEAEKVNGAYLVPHGELVRYLDEVEALPESIIDLRLHKKSINNITANS